MRKYRSWPPKVPTYLDGGFVAVSHGGFTTFIHISSLCQVLKSPYSLTVLTLSCYLKDHRCETVKFRRLRASKTPPKPNIVCGRTCGELHTTCGELHTTFFPKNTPKVYFQAVTGGYREKFPTTSQPKSTYLVYVWRLRFHDPPCRDALFLPPANPN